MRTASLLAALIMSVAGCGSTSPSPARPAFVGTTQPSPRTPVTAEPTTAESSMWLAAPALITLTCANNSLVCWPYTREPMINAELTMPDTYNGMEFTVCYFALADFEKQTAEQRNNGFAPRRLNILAERTQRHQSGGVAGWPIRRYQTLTAESWGNPSLAIPLPNDRYGPGHYRVSAALTVNGEIIGRSAAPVEVDVYDVRFPPQW